MALTIVDQHARVRRPPLLSYTSLTADTSSLGSGLLHRHLFSVPDAGLISAPNHAAAAPPRPTLPARTL